MDASKTARKQAFGKERPVNHSALTPVFAGLRLSEATVKSHLVHIVTKLQVSSRTAAVASARDRGYIRPA
jgi:hypothetical protein